jgi:transposase
MPPSYVKAYVKRNKHDVADAEAICEAVRRPSMRFVPLKTAEQQSALMMHRARDLLIRQRTMLVNALRGNSVEFGLVEAQGLHKVVRLIAIVMDEMDGECARQAGQAHTEERRGKLIELARVWMVAALNEEAAKRKRPSPSGLPRIAS